MQRAISTKHFRKKNVDRNLTQQAPSKIGKGKENLKIIWKLWRKEEKSR